LPLFLCPGFLSPRVLLTCIPTFVYSYIRTFLHPRPAPASDAFCYFKLSTAEGAFEGFAPRVCETPILALRCSSEYWSLIADFLSSFNIHSYIPVFLHTYIPVYFVSFRGQIIRINPMNRSRSSSKSLFFVFFFHCIFTLIVFGAADPFTRCQGSRTPKTGPSQADCPNSYSCSPATGGTSNFIRLKGPILCDVLSAGANSHYTDQDPFIYPVNLKHPLRSF